MKPRRSLRARRRTRKRPSPPRLPPLRNLRVAVVGLNRAGRLLAQHLAVLGVARLILVDPHRVTPLDCQANGYSADDLARRRVYATGDACLRLNPRLDIEFESNLSRYRVASLDVVIRCEGDLAGHDDWYRSGGRPSGRAGGGDHATVLFRPCGQARRGARRAAGGAPGPTARLKRWIVLE